MDDRIRTTAGAHVKVLGEARSATMVSCHWSHLHIRGRVREQLGAGKREVLAGVGQPLDLAPKVLCAPGAWGDAGVHRELSEGERIPQQGNIFGQEGK